jgi:sec-independent protein translocase protein TatC
VNKTKREMPARDHIRELRRRLMWSALFVFAATGGAFYFHVEILRLLMAPAQGFTNVPLEGKPVYLDLTEFIGVAMKVSLLVGMAASIPFVLFQIVMFAAPGLNSKEKRYLYTLLPMSMIAFLAGAAFGYRVLFPPMVNFLLSFGSEVATPLPRIGTYTDLMLRLLFWMGIVFETPLVLFFLSRIGVVTSEWLAKRRKYALIIAFVLGAIITPTLDPINQTIVAVPIIVLYEVGIWLAKIGTHNRNRSREEAAEKSA